MSMSQQSVETGAAMAIKAGPPVAVIGAQFLGYSVPEWVQILTLIYVTLMVIHKLWVMGLEAYRFWWKK